MSKPVHTVLAFDFGLRQIGVAVGNCLLQTSQPLAIVHAKNGKPNWQRVDELMAQWQPDLLVIGDPLNMDGSISELATRARKFANRLHGRFGTPVAMVDERLSSFEAKQAQRELGHRGDYKKQPVDSIAAQLILQSWLRDAGSS